MADLSDVEAALAAAVTGILYPQGINAPSAIGALCRIYRGWPNVASLDTELSQGHVTVTVFPDPSQASITTRYIDPPTTLLPIQPTLTAIVSEQSVAFGGEASVGQVAGVLVDNAAYVHRLVPGDSPPLVAATLAAFISPHRIATAIGSVLTIPGAGSIIARIVADQNATLETRRQRIGVKIGCWCPSPDSRDQVAALIDSTLSATPFLLLPDNSEARLTQSGSLVFDQSQNAGLYRRDLICTVEYPTTVTTTLPAFIFGSAALASGTGSVTRSFLG